VIVNAYSIFNGLNGVGRTDIHDELSLRNFAKRNDTKYLRVLLIV